MDFARTKIRNFKISKKSLVFYFGIFYNKCMKKIKIRR